MYVIVCLSITRHREQKQETKPEMRVHKRSSSVIYIIHISSFYIQNKPNYY